MNLSPLASLGGWVLIGALTLLFFLAGFLIFLPLSLIFERWSGGFLHGVSQSWARSIARLLPFWEIRVEGLERIRKAGPYIVVSNHQSLLDIMVVLARLPLHFKFIAKKELFWIPFLGWHLALARYIPLKRGDAASGRACLEKARSWLRQGVSVLFFPEGTRSPDGEIHEFKPGAFKLALEEKVDLLPLVITGTRNVIPKHAWYVRKKSVLGLHVQEPLFTQNLKPAGLNEFREKVRKQITGEFERLQPTAPP